MKLLFCAKCRDVFNLTEEHKTCSCGRTSGHYTEDRLNAVYSGEYAIPLGFANSSFATALRNRPKDGMGKKFEAFVIPFKCPTMKKTRKRNKK